MVLLCLLIFMVSYIQSYFPAERTALVRQYLYLWALQWQGFQAELRVQGTN